MAKLFAKKLPSHLQKATRNEERFPHTDKGRKSEKLKFVLNSIQQIARYEKMSIFAVASDRHLKRQATKQTKLQRL